IYTGYGVSSDEQAVALFLAWEDQTEGIPELGGPLVLPTWSKSDWVPPGQGVHVMWDTVRADSHDQVHQTSGINVLHMDGSVNFVAYSPLNTSSNFPATLLSAQLFSVDMPQLPLHCR